MSNDELYPELREYIYQYCGKYFWKKQQLRGLHLDQQINSDSANVDMFIERIVNSTAANIGMYKILKRNESVLNNSEIKDLTSDGYEVYQYRIAEKIFKEHKDELDLNLCPRCGKIARTPWAKQCRFCFHDWH